MKIVLLAIGLAVLCLVSAPAEAWTQNGGGPGKAYSSTDPIPRAPEVAFRVELEDRMSDESANLVVTEPVLAGGSAFVRTVAGIHRVSLADGTNERIADLAEIASLMTDRERIFAQTRTGVSAFSLEGRELWSYAFPSALETGEVDSACARPALAEGILYYSCRQYASALSDPTLDPLGTVGGRPGPALLVVAIDAATGEELWAQKRGAQGLVEQAQANGVGTSPRGVIVVAGQLVSVTEEAASADVDAVGTGRRRIEAYDAQTGEPGWHYESTLDDSIEAPTSGKPQGPLAFGSTVIALLDDLMAFDAETGQVRWETPFVEGSAQGGHNARWASHDSVLYGAHHMTITRYDAGGGAAGVVKELDDEKMWDWLAAGDGWLLGHSHDMSTEARLDSGGRLQQVHALFANGASWSYEFGGGPDGDIAIGEGLIVVAEYPKTLTVLGRTSVSIAPMLGGFDPYPAVGETLRIDLSGTRPGLLATDLEYRADWGDGAVDEWQRDPVLAHAYSSPGAFMMNVSARNGAGQVSVESRVVDVGGSPPTATGFLAAQFSAENQERTFFVLGLAVTAAVGAFGIARVQRRRRRLKAELAAIERLYELTHAKPSECDAAMAERRTHVRALLVDGGIDENQYSVLEKRIDDLQKQRRLDAIDEHMGFLPLSMARTLKAALKDGRIERWERSHFMEALEGDMHLTLDQKARVKGLLDEWFAHDARGVIAGPAGERDLLNRS